MVESPGPLSTRLGKRRVRHVASGRSSKGGLRAAAPALDDIRYLPAMATGGLVWAGALLPVVDIGTIATSSHLKRTSRSERNSASSSIRCAREAPLHEIGLPGVVEVSAATRKELLPPR